MIIGVFALLVLLLVAAGVIGVVWLIRRGEGHTESNASGAARRIVLYALLFLLVSIAAVGIAGLLGLVIPAGGEEIAGSDVTELARSLAFTLIAAPITAGFWWFLWNRMDAGERASIGWTLYVALMSFVSLIVASTTFLSTLANLVDGEWNGRTFSTGVVWAGVWGWHRWMTTHPTKSPTTLTDLGPVGGSAFGLVVGAGGLVAVLASVFGTLLEGSDRLVGNTPWWHLPLQGLIWSLGGGLIWWWYWIRDDTRHTETGLSDTGVVLLGTVAPAAAAIVGTGALVYTLLAGAFGPDPFSAVDEAVPGAAAALLVGALIWAYHRVVLAEREVPAQQAARLLLSGIGLVVAASGIGVVVNALLEALTQSLVDTDRLDLLFGGLSALVVGAPVWYAYWRPASPVDAKEVGSTGRSVYLVAVFGVSALTALITVLVIGFRLFEYLLDSGESLIDQIRAPLGLLVAAGLVAGYHYPVWRRDRRHAEQVAVPSRIKHVILVTGSDPDPIRTLIHDTTGAAVTVWRRADTHDGHPSDEHLVEALDGASGNRVMVVTGPGAHLEVIPLRD